MAYQNVLYGKAGAIATITLNRPDKLNAMNDALMAEFDSAVADAENDDDIRVVVFKGAGRSFSTGRDMSAEGTRDTLPPDWRKRPYYTQYLEAERRHQERWEHLFNIPKVTIAQVHGHCLDWGLYLTMVCDFTVVADDARLGDPRVKIGEPTTMPLWNAILGIKKAKEFLYTGKVVDGTEAARLGLATRSLPRGDLQSYVKRLARAMTSLAPDVVVTMKEGLHGALDLKGLGAAWRFCSEVHLFGMIQPVMAGEYSFYDVRDDKGLSTALKGANRRLKKAPQSSQKP